jgi:hypothetical protein
MKLRFCAAALVAALGAAACGGVVSPSSNKTETFKGTVPVHGVSTLHTFTMSNLGEYTITVTDMTPTPPQPFFIIALYYGSDCSTVVSRGAATLGSAGATGANPYKGTYCVQLEDAGYFVGTESYTLSVSHP